MYNYDMVQLEIKEVHILNTGFWLSSLGFRNRNAGSSLFD